MAVLSVDPRTGMIVEEVGEETSSAALEATCARATAAAAGLEDMGPQGRANMLRAMAEMLENDRAGIVSLANRETALGEVRLGSELTRTCFQLRLFADVLREGSYLEVTIDHPADTPMGARPDLRRQLLPLGPVAVFAASNFPLAFSVPGGDTASALAAGCPVVVKAHEGHPATSKRCLRALEQGAVQAGAPEGTVAVIYGQDAGRRLVTHGAMRAVGFTGSLTGGLALYHLVAARTEPIPFYGEMGSLNPVIVTEAAAAERAMDIAEGYVASFSLGAGQFCTKPGLLFVPTGPNGDRVQAGIRQAVANSRSAPMLSNRIRVAFEQGAEALARLPGVNLLGSGEEANMESGFTTTPRLLATTVPTLVGESGERLREECFGPVSVIVSYADEGELLQAVGQLAASLTVTVHTGAGGTGISRDLLRLLESKAGRIVYNGFPTGVAVSWAMHHGGPFPATTSELHTSVGVTSMRRFLRPICYQNAPASVLPAALRDENPWAVPRRVDGQLVPPGADVGGASEPTQPV